MDESPTPATAAAPAPMGAWAAMLMPSLILLSACAAAVTALTPAPQQPPAAPPAAPQAAPQAGPTVVPQAGPSAAPAPGPAAASDARDPAAVPGSADAVLAQLGAEAEALAPLVSSEVARAFLAAVARLPAPEPRAIWRQEATGRFGADRATSALDEPARTGWKRRELDAQTYYFTRYGSPLAYARALDILGRAGLATLEGQRVLDYGYGTIGHLRLMALCGADASGVDVDSYLSALYSEPGDQGPVPATPPTSGRVTLHEGRWPAEDAVRASVGEGYDLFLSKNTLKRGYVHPSREADPRHLIDLGVDDATYLARLAALLEPGGLALLYNICPPEAAPGEPWLPWSDGRSPFTREQWEAAGFELLAFDAVDSAAARAQGVVLGWGSAEALEQDIHAWYTLARRRP